MEGRCNEINDHRNLIIKLLDTMIPTTNDMNYLLLIFCQRGGYNKYDDSCDCDRDEECDSDCKRIVKNQLNNYNPADDKTVIVHVKDDDSDDDNDEASKRNQLKLLQKKLLKTSCEKSNYK